MGTAVPVGAEQWWDWEQLQQALWLAASRHSICVISSREKAWAANSTAN